MKRIGIILIIIVIALSFSSCKEQEEKYEGYGVKTEQKNGKIFVETENIQWSSLVEETEDMPLALSIRSWRRIFSFEIEDDKMRAAKEKALRSIIRTEISSIAGVIKTGKTEFEVSIYREDMEKAIRLLYDAFCLIADEQGNKDGEASEEEKEDLTEKYIDQYSMFYRVIEIYK